MLVLSRRVKEGFVIEVDESVPKDVTVHEYLRDQAIHVVVLANGESFVRLGIQAPEGLKVLRDELV